MMASGEIPMASGMSQKDIIEEADTLANVCAPCDDIEAQGSGRTAFRIKDFPPLPVIDTAQQEREQVLPSPPLPTLRVFI